MTILFFGKYQKALRNILDLGALAYFSSTLYGSSFYSRARIHILSLYGTRPLFAPFNIFSEADVLQKEFELIAF